MQPQVFINAVSEVTRERAQSFLTDDHITRIVTAYREFKDEPGFTRVASIEEIRATDGNLSIPLYVALAAAAAREESRTSGGAALPEALSAWLQSSSRVRQALDLIARSEFASSADAPDLDSTHLLLCNPDWVTLPIFDRTDWTRVRFGDIVENVNETESNPAETGLERFIGLEHLEPGSLHIRSWGEVANGTTFTRRCGPGQVLFGKRRAYQRKVAVAEFDAVVSGDIYVFAPKNDRLLPELLPFLCLSERFFQHAVGTSAGSLSPRTNWSSLANFEFDLPPLDQQRRIAEVLWTVDEAVRAYTATAEKTIMLRMSYLRSTFNRPGKHNLLPVRKTGIVQLGRQRAPKYQTGDSTKPYLRVANVFDGFLDFSDVLQMDFDERDFETYRLSKGDILLNEGQSRELVGRCAIYDGKIANCCFQNTLIRYRAGESLLTEYAFVFFQYCFHAGVFAAISSQTTSIAHLGADRFGSLTMPVPSKAEQQKIAQEFERFRRAELGLADDANKMRQLHNKFINSFLL